ncbi:MAG: DNA translocase FtsK 4TM domain-containing protein, partial [Sphingomicrobium sp.]
MATAAARARKRELGPDWRDALRVSLARFATRCWGAVLIALGVATAVALITHSGTDPSFSTAAGGPPTNWIGSAGAYASDLLLLLFGIGAALLVPVVALAGVRLMRLEPVGRVG